mmetsp:Transcript_41285/g.47595  ORF Transcript_41285/g.47595 Transcript_41285/m.47595 type:complete len:82 (+) Transcript_41285:693-938(+)
MPFDNIKTFLQKYNLEEVDGAKVEKRKHVSILSGIRKIYKKAGVLGFFTGWRIKLFVNFINSSFTVVLLEYLENLQALKSD